MNGSASLQHRHMCPLSPADSVLKSSLLPTLSWSLPAAMEQEQPVASLLRGAKSPADTEVSQSPVSWGRIIPSLLPVWQMTQKLIDSFKVTRRVSGRLENGTQEP